VTTVFVTHDQEEAFEIADRVLVLQAGRDDSPCRRPSWPAGSYGGSDRQGAALGIPGQSLLRVAGHRQYPDAR
jgi:energy-coupling factor transporter ATP-binding protein EcfA2